jgi:ribosomal protein S18 acetylase RimI-like enzyme
MLIRKADITDLDFIVESIIQSDKSGSELISYCRIYNIAEQRLAEALRSILPENLGGFDISLNCFRVAVIDGQTMSAAAAWVEGMDGIASGKRKLSAFSMVFPRDLINYSKDHLAILSDITIEREIGTLQLEAIYTDASYRRQGIASKIIESHIIALKTNYPQIQKAQIQVMKENNSAVNAYRKMGFTIAEERTSQNREILKLLPGATKLLLEKDITK